MSQAAEPALLRSPLERLRQTLWFEALGVALVAPLYAWATDSAAMESLGLLLALSVLVMAWSAVYNTLFDRWEWRCHRRAASDRPPGLRTVHAIGLEATVVTLSCPLIMVVTGLDFWPALGLDLALSAVYAAYGWGFHWGYDRLRPVRA